MLGLMSCATGLLDNKQGHLTAVYVWGIPYLKNLGGR